MTTYSKESEFEAAVIHELRQRGWGDAEVIKHASESDLLANWKQILFENNRSKDRLNEVPLTDSEMQQVMEQITALRTPLKLNGFINGKTVAITRDNPADTLRFGKEVSLKVYDRHEIAAGQSRYQIAQQPRYAKRIGEGNRPTRRFIRRLEPVMSQFEQYLGGFLEELGGRLIGHRVPRRTHAPRKLKRWNPPAKKPGGFQTGGDHASEVAHRVFP